MKWKDDNDVKPIYLEQTVSSKYWAGTLDFLGWYNGKLYVIDWKSSKSFYPEMRYQIAAYRSAAPRHGVEGCAVLRLDKLTGLPEFKDYSKTYEKDLKVFNAMVDLFYLRHPRLAKKAGYEED